MKDESMLSNLSRGILSLLLFSSCSIFRSNEPQSPLLKHIPGTYIGIYNGRTEKLILYPRDSTKWKLSLDTSDPKNELTIYTDREGNIYKTPRSAGYSIPPYEIVDCWPTAGKYVHHTYDSVGNSKMNIGGWVWREGLYEGDMPDEIGCAQLQLSDKNDYHRGLSGNICFTTGKDSLIIHNYRGSAFGDEKFFPASLYVRSLK